MKVQTGTNHQKRAGIIAKQDSFVNAYTANLFNVSEACRLTGIGRTTFYRWIKDDEHFREKLKVARDEKIDFIENALMTKIAKGDTIAIIFALKCLAKSRGYVETQQHRISVDEPQLTNEQKDAAVNATLLSIKFEREGKLFIENQAKASDGSDDELGYLDVSNNSTAMVTPPPGYAS